MIAYNNTNIECVFVTKYLGMQLDPSLSFQEHANYLRKKTLGKIKLLGRVGNILDRATSLTLYKKLVLPIYDYNDFLYDCMPQKSSLMLQRLQNMCFKLILHTDKRTATSVIHNKMNIWTYYKSAGPNM